MSVQNLLVAPANYKQLQNFFVTFENYCSKYWLSFPERLVARKYFYTDKRGRRQEEPDDCLKLIIVKYVADYLWEHRGETIKSEQQARATAWGSIATLKDKLLRRRQMFILDTETFPYIDRNNTLSLAQFELHLIDALHGSRFNSKKLVAQATNQELLEVPGIGENELRKIRRFIPHHTEVFYLKQKGAQLQKSLF